jgi:hypothetical protein
MTHEEARAELVAAEADLQRAHERVAAAVANLPVLPIPRVSEDDPEDCESHEATYYEGGYCQMSEMTYEDGWSAYNDGWDDMSEGGAFAYAEWNGMPWQLPDDLGWS